MLGVLADAKRGEVKKMQVRDRDAELGDGRDGAERMMPAITLCQRGPKDVRLVDSGYYETPPWFVPWWSEPAVPGVLACGLASQPSCSSAGSSVTTHHSPVPDHLVCRPHTQKWQRQGDVTGWQHRSAAFEPLRQGPWRLRLVTGGGAASSWSAIFDLRQRSRTPSTPDSHPPAAQPPPPSPSGATNPATEACSRGKPEYELLVSPTGKMFY